MKKIILLILLLISIGLVSYAQKLTKKDIPAKVQATFEKNYPKKSGVKWEKINTNYEASFIFDSKKTSVVIDANGNLMEKKEEISITMMPKPAISYFHQNYHKEKLRETSKIIDNKGTVTYEIGLKKTDLLFDNKGSFIKKTK
jgi:hypothetical protein